MSKNNEMRVNFSKRIKFSGRSEYIIKKMFAYIIDQKYITKVMYYPYIFVEAENDLYNVWREHYKGNNVQYEDLRKSILLIRSLDNINLIECGRVFVDHSVSENIIMEAQKGIVELKNKIKRQENTLNMLGIYK